jgi:hypothetical protein
MATLYVKRLNRELAVPLPSTERELAELFRQLGAPSPEQWAQSQVTEGIPQLARFLFLKHAWTKVVAEGSTAWIDNAIRSALARPGLPYAGLGGALARCKAAGVSTDDLTEIARCLQASMLFAIAYLLEGSPFPGIDLSWGLFETDEHGNPKGPRVSGLHESVLELDPTGREMRPKS